MAVVSLGLLGSITASAAGTTLAVPNSTGAIIPAGTLIHITGTWDNIASVTAPTITCSTIGGATATANHATPVGSGVTTTAGSGIWHTCFRAVTTADIAIGATIATLTSNQSAVKRAAHANGASGALATLRGSSAVTNASTIGAGSAAGFSLVIGDLAIGSISFEHNALWAGDTDTTGGSWSAVVGTFTTGGGTATNVGTATQVKIVDAAGAQTYNPATTASTDTVCCIYAVQPVPDPTVTQLAYRFFYADGTDASSTSRAAQDTAPTVDVSGGEVNLHLRTRLQSTNAADIPTTDGWQLQYEKNASGTWANLGSSEAVAPYDSPRLTDGANASTNLLSGGTGSYQVGRVSEDGLAENFGWTANNYTDLVYALTVRQDARTDALLDSYPETNYDGSWSLDDLTWSVGQTFLGDGKKLSRVAFFMFVGNNSPPAGTMTANLYAHTGTFGAGGTATGSPLATSLPVSVAALTSQRALITFTFDGTVTLTNATPYVLVVTYTLGGSTRYINLGADTTSPTHAGNVVKRSNTGVWSASNTEDLIFRLYTTTTAIPAPILVNGDALRFRVQRNGATTGLTYTQVPTININPVPSITQAAYRFFGTGTESGSGSSPEPQNTTYVRTNPGLDMTLQLRVMLQATTAVAVPATSDFRLQYDVDASGIWSNLNPWLRVADSASTFNSYTALEGTLNAVAQSFTGDDGMLAFIICLGKRIGTPNGVLTASVYAHSGTFGTSSVPTGPALVSNSINCSSVGTADANIQFDMGNTLKLVKGTRYVLVVETTNSASAGNNVSLRDNTAGTHAGNYSSRTVSTWTPVASRDLYFFAWTNGLEGVMAYDDGSLTEGGSTTSRLTGGTGSFVAGKVSEDGLVDDLGWAGSNYTELVYSIVLPLGAYQGSHNVRFRVLKDDSTTDMTYTQIPTMTVVVPITVTLTRSTTWNVRTPAVLVRATSWDTLRVVPSGAAENFTSGVIPADIIRSSGSVQIDATVGNPTPSLRSDGGGSWWYFTDPKWTVSGDFSLTYDLMFPSSATRDIANLAFFMTDVGATANTTADGYMFRIETGGATGWFEVLNGVHGAPIPGSQDIGVIASRNTWMRVTLSVVGNQATAVVRNAATLVQIGGTATATLPAGNRTGTFGEKQDGAGAAEGHRWDNFVLNGGEAVTRIRGTTWDSLAVVQGWTPVVTDNFTGAEDSNLHDRPTTTGGGTWKVGPSYNQSGSASFGTFAIKSNKLANTVDQFNNNFSLNHPAQPLAGRRATFDYNTGSAQRLLAFGNNSLAITAANGGSIEAGAAGTVVATGVGTTGTFQAEWLANGSYIVRINGTVQATGTLAVVGWSDTQVDCMWVVSATATWDNYALASLDPATSLTRGTTWNLKGRMSTSRAVTWNVAGVLTPVTVSRSTTWHVPAPVTTTRAVTWHATAAVSATRATTWHVRSPATASRPVTWHALAPLAATRAITWRVFGGVSVSQATTWTVAAPVSASRPTTWDVAAGLVPVTASRASTWHAKASVTGTWSTTWVAKAQGSATRSTTWVVAAPLTATRLTTWHVRAGLTGLTATTWRVFTPLSANRATTWQVSVSVSATKATSWNVVGPLATSRAVSWHALASVSTAPGPAERMLDDSLPTTTATGTLTLGARFVVNADGYLTHVRYYQVAGAPPGTRHTVSVWNANTQAKIATTTFVPAGG